jgi:hypothetical protein
MMDKPVRNAMDKKFMQSFNSAVELGKGIVDLLGDVTARNQELDRQMAAIRLEQMNLENEKARRAQILQACMALTEERNNTKTMIDSCETRLASVEMQMNKEILVIKQKYQSEIDEVKKTKDELLETVRKLDMNISNLSSQVRTAYGANKSGTTNQIVPMKTGNSMGANELYAWIGSVSGTMDFKILRSTGPSNSPTFTAQLICTFPQRAKPLNVSMTYSLTGNKQQLKNDMCGSLLPQLKSWYADLTMHGDVSANPGPIYYAWDDDLEDFKVGPNPVKEPVWRTNQPQRIWVRASPGQFDHQTKNCRNMARRDKNRLSKLEQKRQGNLLYTQSYLDLEAKSWKIQQKTRIDKTKGRIPQDVEQKDLEVTPEQEVEMDIKRSKYYRKQKDEKNIRMERDYRSKHNRLRYPVYSGNMRDDLKQFWSYLDEHGYASNQTHKIPPWIIQRNFEQWCRNGKLVTAIALQHIFRKKNQFFICKDQMPQYRARKLLLSAFVADPLIPEPFLYLRAFLHRTTQMPTNVGVLLKDVIKARNKIERKRMWEDLSRTEEQMNKSYTANTWDSEETDGEKKLLDKMLAPKSESWVGGTIRSVGRKIGEGMTDVVVPILDKVGTSVRQAFQSFPDLATIYLIVKIVAVIIMVAILGWAIVVFCRTITMGIESFMPPELGPCDDLSQAKEQHLSFGLAKVVSSSWLESLDKSLKSFNNAFSDAQILVCVKKIGDFSSAVKNATWLIEKIKEMFVWCVNRTSSLLWGSPFFQDAKNVHSLQTKITKLIETVSIADITNLTDPMKEDFAKAYQDLVEMYPFVFKVDKFLGGMIQSALAKSQSLYKQCVFFIKTNITRMEPYYIAIDGIAGQGKTYLMGHLAKMIYDSMRVMSPSTWKALFYKNGEPANEWTDTLIYNRQPEQEYWDNYNNQPITKIDDLGQSMEIETRAAEFFSIIRMVNNDPYPLHMAEIARKDNTVFSSFLVITSTNMSEVLFKKPGDLGILEPQAYLRRRDISITCSRVPGHIKEGVQSVKYLDGYRLRVYHPDKKTGDLGEVDLVNGYDELAMMVSHITKEIVARYHEFTVGKKMDHTGHFATLGLKQEQVMNETYGKKQKKDHEVVNIDGASDDDIDLEALPETTAGTTTARTDEEEDLADTEEQMYLALNIHELPKLYRNMRYGVHPSVVLFLKLHGKIVTTYDEAQLAVQDLRKHDKKEFASKGWDHDFIVNGIVSPREHDKGLEESRLMCLWKYTMCAYKQKLRKVDKVLIAAIQKEFPQIRPWDVDYYIGLTNPLYWVDKSKVNDIFYNTLGITPLWFDHVGTYTGSVDWSEYKELIYFELSHEKELRASRGNSLAIVIFSTYVKLAAAFVGLSLVVAAAVLIYRRLDPMREVNMKFVEEQSSDPRLNRAQRDIARARALPKTRMDLKNAKLQFTDDNARALLPLLRKNTYTLRGTTDQREFGGYAVGIEGSIFVVPGHFMHAAPTTIYIAEQDGTRELQYSADQVKWRYVRPIGGLSSADLALMYVPCTQYVKKISHLLFKEDDILDFAQGCCREERGEPVKEGSVTTNTYTITEAPDPVVIVNSNNYAVGSAGGSRRVEQIAKIKMSAGSGFCVKPYIYFNPAMPRKLGHFHIGQNGDFSLAGRLNQEDVEDFKKFLDESLDDVQQQIRQFEIESLPDVLPQHKVKFNYVPDEGIFGIDVMGKLNYKFPYPQKSQIISTPMCKISPVVVNGELIHKDPPYPVEGEPALLRTKGDLNPLDIGFQSCKKRKIIYGGYLQPVDYKGIFNRALKNSTGRVLPIWEALKGIRNHPHSHSIKRSTSTAFYHKIFCKLKRSYIDLNKDEYMVRKDKEDVVHVGQDVYLHRDILDLVIMWFQKLKTGKVPMNWVVAMLKDEIRPKDRVKQGKTRIFYAGQFAFLIVSRMVFGDFVTELETNFLDTDIAVGCNPYSSDWRFIFSKITRFGFKVKDDDTEKWDQNFPTTEFICTFPNEYCKYYNLTDQEIDIDLITTTVRLKHKMLVYAVIICNFHCAVVVIDVVIFLILQASGVDLTTILNSIANSAINRCLVRRLTNEDFDEVAAQWTYGDDLLLNCPIIPRQLLWDEAKRLFNHIRTDPAKGTEAIDDSLISTALFLQRGFRYMGVLVCPLNKKSIYSMLQWIDKPKDKTFEEQFAINCKVALMEISRHGRDDFEAMKKEVNIYLSQYGSSWVINITWQEAYNDIVFRATF